MISSIDLPLAISLVKFKHQIGNDQSFNDFISSVVLKNIGRNEKTKLITRRSNKTRKGKLIQSGVRKSATRSMPRAFFSCLDALGVRDYEESTTNFISLNKHIPIANLKDLNNLLILLKFLFRSDTSLKNLYLMKVATNSFKNVATRVLKLLKPGQRISWNLIFKCLEECLIVTVSFKKNMDNFVLFKLSQLEIIYKSIILKLQKFERIRLRVLQDFILNISKLIVFSTFKENFDGPKHLLELVDQMQLSKTLKEELKRFIAEEFKFNATNLSFYRLDQLLTSQIENSSLLDLLVRFYLKMIKCYLENLKPMKLDLSCIRKDLLSLLILHGNSENISQYQDINFEEYS